MNIENMSREYAEMAIHNMETKLNRQLTDLSNMDFFELRDLVEELEAEVSYHRFEA